MSKLHLVKLKGRSDTERNLESTCTNFTVCLVAWPLSESEAGVELFLQKPPCFSYVNDAVFVLISSNLYEKSSEASIKTLSTPASLSFKGQATKYTTVKL